MTFTLIVGLIAFVLGYALGLTSGRVLDEAKRHYAEFWGESP